MPRQFLSSMYVFPVHLRLERKSQQDELQQYHLSILNSIHRGEDKGRIKVCSKSLVFEPDDVRIPLVKLPFKYFLGTPKVFR